MAGRVWWRRLHNGQVGLRRWACVLAAAALLGVGMPSPTEALETLRFRVPGASEDVEEALRAASLLIEARNNEVTNTVDLLAAARADYARILGALYALGRFGPTVSIQIDGQEAADIDPLTRLRNIDIIEVRVETGPVYRFSRAEIDPLATGTELPDAFRTGAPAETPVIEDAVDVAVSAWRDVGHAKVDVAGQVVVANHRRERLRAEVTLDEGPRLRFGDLVIRGQSDVSERRIRKIAGLPTGELFNPSDLELSATRLRRTGTFSSVALTEAGVPNADGTLDIVARIVDQKPRRFGFGAEIESTEGLGLSAFWLHRNLRGGAERLRIDAEVGGIGGTTGGTDASLGFELTRPATPDARTDAVLSGEVAHLDEPEFTSDTANLGIDFVREVNATVTARAGVSFNFSDVTDASGSTIYKQFFLPLGATLDERDDLLNTTHGHYLDLEVAPFAGISGSESGVRSTLEARLFRSLGERIVLAGRVQAKSITGATITGLPNELRFTSGGGGTVRGQEFQALDLGLGDGLRSGGRNFIGLQSEIRGRVTDAISLVGFYDWGQIGRDSLPGSSGVSHSGAGLGIRYDTGIGPIRFDVAVPVTSPDDASGVQFYIGIGQAF